MIYLKNTSNLNIAYWFYNKAKSSKINLSEQKLQYLLFLTQMHYSAKYTKLLMPSLFVYSQSGIYDPSIRTIMKYGFPLMSDPQFSADVSSFLNLIWQKYSSLNDVDLREFVYSLKCLKQYSDSNDEIIINPFNLADSFAASIKSENTTAKKTKIMISQNGPVKVSAWTPKKIKK